jgi:hypothetical protein
MCAPTRRNVCRNVCVGGPYDVHVYRCMRYEARVASYEVHVSRRHAPQISYGASSHTLRGMCVATCIIRRVGLLAISNYIQHLAECLVLCTQDVFVFYTAKQKLVFVFYKAFSLVLCTRSCERVSECVCVYVCVCVRA